MRKPFLVTVALAACTEYDLQGANPPPAASAVPDVRIEPAEVVLAAGVGCDASATVTLTNDGTADLHVASVTVEGPGTFAVTPLALTLAPGASATTDVTFRPSSGATSFAKVVVASDDPDEARSEVPTMGEALGPGPRVDEWTQNGQGLVDVLWVIDNSGSMQPHQEKVQDSIGRFFDWFRTLGLDYHMGVITTEVVEPTQQGRLQGSPAYITPATPDAEGALARAVDVGENDVGDEAGLQAMELALSEPVRSGANAGFYRPEAFLSVIQLSDEPEQSTESAAHYSQFLLDLKGDPMLVSLSAIVGPSGGCGNLCGFQWYDAEPGTKYISVQQTSGGVFESVCSCDYADALDDIGWTSAGFRTTFPLSSEPLDPSAIEVLVDGVRATGWTYDPVRNAIVFDEASVPGEFAHVEARYESDGTC